MPCPCPTSLTLLVWLTCHFLQEVLRPPFFWKSQSILLKTAVALCPSGSAFSVCLGAQQERNPFLKRGRAKLSWGEGTTDLGGPSSLCTQEASGIAVNRPPTWRPPRNATPGMLPETAQHWLSVRKANCSLCKCRGIGHEARPGQTMSQEWLTVLVILGGGTRKRPLPLCSMSTF